MKVLHRKAKRVKLDRTTIVSGKTTDRDQIFNDACSNQNMEKMKRAVRKKIWKRSMSGGGDRNRRAVSNNMTINRMWRERGEDTGVGGEVRGRTAVHDPLRGGLLQCHVGEVLSKGGGIP